MLQKNVALRMNWNQLFEKYLYNQPEQSSRNSISIN